MFCSLIVLLVLVVLVRSGLPVLTVPVLVLTVPVLAVLVLAVLVLFVLAVAVPTVLVAASRTRSIAGTACPMTFASERRNVVIPLRCAHHGGAAVRQPPRCVFTTAPGVRNAAIEASLRSLRGYSGDYSRCQTLSQFITKPYVRLDGIIGKVRSRRLSSDKHPWSAELYDPRRTELVVDRAPFPATRLSLIAGIIYLFTRRRGANIYLK